MGDYNLSGLNWRDFEHIVQALGKKNIAPGLTPFGDGKDGGREATFEGPMTYPSSAGAWSGYLVVQCKFLQKPSFDTNRDGQWILRETKKELRKLDRTKNGYRAPEYYIVATNVALTAAPESGSKDKLRSLLQKEKTAGRLKDFDVWSYDELCRFIDGSSDVRRAYAGFITSGDVLSQLAEILGNPRHKFVEVMNSFLQKELRNEQAARLESAGQHFDQQVALAKVFVDLPATEKLEKASSPQESKNDKDYFQAVSTILVHGSACLRQRAFSLQGQSGIDLKPIDARLSRFVVVGGPGQGKSTLGQYLCQLYRAAIVRARPQEVVDPVVRQIVQQLEDQRTEERSRLPDVRRFPIRVVLNQYADELAQRADMTLLRYISEEVSRLGAAECSVSDLKDWLAAYPWIVVLDGLDEVPTSSNRQSVLKEIEDFRIEASALNADLLLIATTRPQGYSSEFSPEVFTHIYLTPLSARQALDYGHRLIENRCGTDEPRKALVLKRLVKACETPATVRLMRSPLQVTIMATLVERIGEPPHQRYRLFEQYYRTIYDREVNRESVLSEILSNRKTDIDLIHYRTGLLLQTLSETAGRTEARLTDDAFKELVNERLKEVEEIGPQADELMKLIAPSIDRLVFIVRPQQGFVGFEIRSLQEFMAAEALLKGHDKDVRKRLRQIAPIAHWRNVFLFAVGKCFAEHEHYLEFIDFLCRDLNDEATDPVAEATLWGARLALDILAEGVAKQHPRFERSLARNALQLLALPDPHANAKLAAAYDVQLKDLYNDAIHTHLRNRRNEPCIGVWALLSALAEKNVDWALREINKQYLVGAAPKLSQLMISPYRSLSKWLIPIVTQCLPQEDHLASHLFRAGPEWDERDDIPLWLRAVSIAPFFGRQMSAALNVRGSKRPLALWFGSLLDPNAKHLRHLADIPGNKVNWETWRAVGRFAANPSVGALAAELRSISKIWNNATLSLVPGPWPLCACVETARSREDLEEFARRAESGELGDVADWMAAEERWKRSGLQQADLDSMIDGWPFDKGIAKTGFPFSAAWGHADPELAGPLLEIFTSLPESRVRSWIASCLVSTSAPPFDGPSVPRIRVTPEQFRELISAAIQYDPVFISDFLRIITPPALPDSAWSTAFHWLGQQRSNMYLHVSKDWDWTPTLVSSYLLNPSALSGLLPLLGKAAIAGNTVNIPLVLADPTTLSDSAQKTGAIAIQLVCAPLGARQVAEYATSMNDHCSMDEAAQIAGSTSIASDRRCEFVLRLLSLISPSAAEESQRLISILVEVMSARSTHFDDSHEWASLSLPNVGRY